MSNPLETSIPRGQEVLRFSYKGEKCLVPVARNLFQLKTAIAGRVIPGLDKLQAESTIDVETGIAFVPYYYETDDLMFTNPEAVKAMVKHMRAAGLYIPDDVLTNPKKLDPIGPEKTMFVSYIRNTPDYYRPLQDFSEGTFLIGPMSVQPIHRTPGLLDLVDEKEASQLIVEATVAIHGEAFLADYSLQEWPNNDRDRIFNREIIEILEIAFRPHPPL